MISYGTSQIAELLGVSADTVRRWCDDGRLASHRESGQRMVRGEDLATYLVEQTGAYEPDSVMSQSARNRFTGIVTRVERDKLVAIVEIHAPPHRVVSMMTREAADELDLQPGDLATAAVKSTNVVIEIPS
ncbi:MAG: binding domain protein excisionase family [Acidimicrobiales bacterium]|nr:binding domain protein excisionase family [Acidimicrobiales bacterium]